MTLCRAFWLLGAPHREGTRDDQEQAARLVLGELWRLGRRVRMESSIVEDAVTVVLSRLVSGVHQRARTPPATDDDVRGYCFRMLSRTAISLVRVRERSRKRFEPLDAIVERAGDAHAALMDLSWSERERDIDLERARQALEAARRELRETIVPRLAADLRSDGRTSFLESFADLEAVASGATTTQAVLARRARQHGAAALDSPQARNGFDQRCSRIRRALLEFLRRLPPETPRERRLALEAAVGELRLRS